MKRDWSHQSKDSKSYQPKDDGAFVDELARSQVPGQESVIPCHLPVGSLLCDLEDQFQRLVSPARVKDMGKRGIDFQALGTVEVWVYPQNRIDYGKEKLFRGFDVRRGAWQSPFDADVDFFDIALKPLRMVHYGYLRDMQESLVSTAPEYGALASSNSAWEGVVIRPQASILDRWGRRVILKWKNPKFDEVKPPREPKDVESPDAADIEAILRYCTVERMAHVVAHLSEGGVVLDIRNTGDVIREFIADVRREATDLTDTQAHLLGKVVPGKARVLFHESFLSGVGA